MLFRKSEATFANAVVEWGFANPFDAEALKRHARAAANVRLPDEVRSRVVPRRSLAWGESAAELLRDAEALTECLRDRLDGSPLADEERELYRDLALFTIYFRYRDAFEKTHAAAFHHTTDIGKRRGPRADYFADFARDVRYYLDAASGIDTSDRALAHWFAGFFQIRRAFLLIHTQIFGDSKPVAQLRAAVWQSIFTHDMRRYRDRLYDRMHDFATLITGPSGTGKDLVAAAIGLSRYVAFDPRTQSFVEALDGAFHPVNLAALPSQLIESELFGHCKGAFTGALADRVGWLENCKRCHSVFLDEIGELASEIQVKLLRVLQNRTLNRLGESTARRFEGKVIAATNRDLSEQIARGEFRRDFYYRLCSDTIQTPMLAEQLRDHPAELPRLVGFVVERICNEADGRLAVKIAEWIETHLGSAYAWPGNFRELEQCVRNILVRGRYEPMQTATTREEAGFLARIAEVDVTADELLNWYCSQAFARERNYVAAAERLKMDRRTLKAHATEWGK